MTVHLTRPLPGHPVTGGYGWRTIDGQKDFHTGTDIGAPSGTPIGAAGVGKIVHVGWDPPGYGNYVDVDHGGGIRTRYAHMRDRSPLNVGDRVASGGTVGVVGSTGWSTGPHLHFEVWVDGAHLDPLAHISAQNLPKGDTVIHYHKEYRKTRTIKPRQRLYLVDAKGAKANVVGGVGPYTLTAHLYGDGFAPGDILELRYDWYDTKTKKTSPHYLHRVEADKHGMIRENATFQRAVAAGFAVYLSVYAGQANKKSGTVSVLDSDAYLHTA